MAIFARQDGIGDELVHHSGRGVQGEFNRSSQHLQVEVGGWDGHKDGRLLGRAAGDAFAGAASGGQARTPAAVLGGDRQGNAE